MIKPLHVLTLFFLFTGISINSYAQFPYVESFKNSSARGIIFGGTPSAFLTAAGNAYDSNSSAHTGIPIDQNGNGYLRLTTNQRNEKGYAISTSIFPSTNGLSVMFEYYIYGGNGADGISFFLFDATADPINIGGFGGSLGYAQYTNTSPTSPGVSKGYLAIGLDEYGNFSNPTEGRQGGIPGLSPGSITLRGKGNGASTTPENYAYLTSAQMRNFGFELIGSAGRIANPTDQGYRKVYMDMIPNTNGGYNITVRVTRGGAPQNTVTVISNFYYSEAAPVNLRYGFASSTGDQTNFHEIRNVNIDAYNSDGLTNPVATDDLLSVCQGKTSVIDVLKNDTTSNPGANLVRTSIDLNPSQAGIQSRFDVEGKGFFSLNSEGLVEFEPMGLFIGQVSCFYNIKDSFGRVSNAGMISSTYLAPPDQPNAGPDQVVNISSPTGNAMLLGSPTLGNSGKWTKISGPLAGTINSPLVSGTSVTDLQGGMYIFRWSLTSPGGCELYDDVQVIVNHIPIAKNDTVTIKALKTIAIPILNNDSDADGSQTLAPATIVFKTQPLHGTIEFNIITGVVTYTAANNYNGTDTFSYSVKDDYGAESNIATVFINITVKPIGQNDFVKTITNSSLKIAVQENDATKIEVTVTKASDPVNGTILINSDGTVSYTPKLGFSGKDSFTYILRTPDGLSSDPIIVNVDVIPFGSPDNISTPLNKPITILAKENDLSKVGTSIIPGARPENGSIILDASGNVIYTPNRGYTGTDSFTYTLQTAEGLSSSPILVAVTVTPIVLPVPPDFNIAVPINEPLTIDVPIPAESTVLIIVLPKHGTITLDQVTGKPIYSPAPGYSGPDDFSYIIRDADGNESVPGKVTLTVFIPAKIGLAKSLKLGPVKNLDGTFDLTYLFTLINYGEVAIDRLSLTDDLLAVFNGNTIKVNQVTATGSLVPNLNYNGTSIKELLSSGSTLVKLSKEYVEVSINVALDRQEGTFNNTAFTEGYSATSDGSKVSDVSTNGLNPDPVTPADVSPSEATPVKIVRQELFIPGGFSPNNDGINDYFVIENTQGKKIHLEVYNRWGNLIHRSKTYQNDWAGKTTEGIHLGDDVPTGTYYYIIKIDDKDKRVGYITINR